MNAALQLDRSSLLPIQPRGLTLITDGHPRRMTFLPKHFGHADMMRIEPLIYAYADLTLDGYTGGVWDFAELPDGSAGFLIPPAGAITVQVGDDFVTHGYEWKGSEISCFDGGKITRQAAGLALTILAVNHHMNGSRVRDIEKLVVLWDRLMAYSRERPEARTLYRILD